MSVGLSALPVEPFTQRWILGYFLANSGTLAESYLKTHATLLTSTFHCFELDKPGNVFKRWRILGQTYLQKGKEEPLKETFGQFMIGVYAQFRPNRLCVCRLGWM